MGTVHGVLGSLLMFTYMRGRRLEKPAVGAYSEGACLVYCLLTLYTLSSKSGFLRGEPGTKVQGVPPGVTQPGNNKAREPRTHDQATGKRKIRNKNIHVRAGNVCSEDFKLQNAFLQPHYCASDLVS